MAELCYTTMQELKKYQEGHPAHVFATDHLDILKDKKIPHVGIIISDELNQIVRNDDGVTGFHLVRQK